MSDQTNGDEDQTYSMKSGIHRGTVNLDIGNAIVAPCAVVMVGLPARGKTYMAKKLARYLNWVGLETQVFNVGEYRRRYMLENNFTCSTTDFFRPGNDEARKIRDHCGDEALNDLVEYLKNGGDVGVYDATNAKRKHRKKIFDVLSKEHNVKILFIESVCTDPAIIEANIREVKVSSPDYTGVDTEGAIAEFHKRIESMQSEYETIDEHADNEMSFIKIYNQGEKFLVNRIQAFACPVQVDRGRPHEQANLVELGNLH